ncbi:hypothetical protein V500_03418 [Pseudogymnoascus sp. VKM F-4518 (FW-2643)]|nr:hypothetical protein V500_03418 [Pseudogymnoascus sp. VKM F-4518 (FW-2643)]
MHSAILLKAEVKALQAANEQKKRRERKRKRRIMQGGSLSVREGEDILQTAEVDAQIRTEVASEATQQRIIHRPEKGAVRIDLRETIIKLLYDRTNTDNS